MRGMWTAAAVLALNLAGAAAADDLSGLSATDAYYNEAGPDAIQAPLADKLGDKMDMVQSPLQGPPACGGDFSCCFQACQFPCIYFQADALYWDRVGSGCSDILVIDTDDDSPLLSTDDVNFRGAAGARFLIGWQPHHCSNCCAWELSYWGLYNWNADATVTGTGDLAIPGDLGLASNNFFLADTLDLHYRSELHNVELNCIKSCCAGCAKIDFIAGVRYLALNDSLTLTATDLQEGTSSYNIDSHNDLYGLQLGGRYTRPLCCRWGVELTGKAGLFYNDVSTNQLVTDFPNTPGAFVLRDTAASRDGVAMLGELGVVLIRPLNECWNFRVGYNAIGIGGLALAPDQLDFTDTLTSGTEIHHTGWIFAHGGVVGLERRW
jgi:hypothetical protein